MIKKKWLSWERGAEAWLHFAVVSPQQPQRHSLFFFSFMMEWNPYGNPAGMQHAVVQKPLSVLRPPFPATSHPGGHWWTCGILGVLQCHWTSIFCHTRVRAPPCSVHLQPCGYEAWEAGCTCPSCPFACTMVTGQQAAFLLTACSQTCRHTCCEGHALRSVFSQFVHFLRQHPCDILKTSSSSSSSISRPNMAVILFLHVY